jgi:hypothetical protein
VAGDSRNDDGSINWATAREFWAFTAPQIQELPEVKAKEWPNQPIDYFILAKLEANKLGPSAAASRRTLIRRVTYGLTGLPPTPEETEAFISDSRPDAYERLVDRLLASPQYGERVASLWLNLVRYAEDQAHQVGTNIKHFYPNAYRYRSWLIDSFNNDLPYDRFVELQLAADKQEDPDISDLPALGFIGLGPKYYNRSRLDVQADEWEDRVDTVTRTFLGLTVACARCHDHKYDPISTEDYYAMAGVFASIQMINKVPGGSPPVEETPKEGEEKKEETISPDALHIVEDGEIQDLHVFLRGNVEQKGHLVERGFLRVLSDENNLAFGAKDSGRKELAQRIIDPANPLTARVLVNRIWDMVFGQGLVRSTSNFGSLGERPTHPELLDDLAVRFTENGLSIKSLVRELVLSSTFRQSSQSREDLKQIDQENFLLGRMNRSRLTVEMWRDTLLSVCEQLQPATGPSLELDDPDNYNRTVYGRVSRKQLNSLLALFDYPDPNVHSGQRAETTTPVQKLFVLNSPFMMDRASTLAERLIRETIENDEARIQRAYQLLYCRPAEPREVELATAFLKREANRPASRWEQYAQALLSANEIMYLD